MLLPLYAYAVSIIKPIAVYCGHLSADLLDLLRSSNRVRTPEALKSPGVLGIQYAW